MSERVGRVGELWVYPVKSLLGQPLEQVRCTERGFFRDRWWAIEGVDGKFASGKTSRRFRHMPGLLSMASYLDPTGTAWIRLPDGTALRVDDPLAARRVSEVVGETVSISSERDVSHLDAEPVHLLTRSSLDWLAGQRPRDGVDRRRFRPNVLIDANETGLVEDGWVGRELEVGDAILSVSARVVRCVMITMPQDGVSAAPALLRGLYDLTESQLGVYGRVVREGTIRVGDDVVLRG